MCKFPPQGIRGCGSPFAPSHFGQSMPEYLATANKTTMVIVQIETPLGLKNVNEIASVPGIGECWNFGCEMAFSVQDFGSCSANRTPNYVAIYILIAHNNRHALYWA